MIINGILAGTGRSLGKAGGSNLPIKILTKEEYEAMDKQEGVIYIISDEEPADGLIKVTRAEYDALENIEPDKLYVITDEELDDVDLSAYYTKSETDSITSSLASKTSVQELRNYLYNYYYAANVMEANFAKKVELEEIKTLLGEINARLESI